MIKHTFFAAAFAVAGFVGLAAPAHAELFAAKSNWGCLSNQNGDAVLAGCSVSRHQSSIPYLPNENVFYGPLTQGTKCLDVQGSRVLFTACNGRPSQKWKFSGSGQFNNEESKCIVGSGNSLVVQGCPSAGTWMNVSSFKVVNVPAAMAVPRGTLLKIAGANLVNASTGALVAAGGGNLVAAGGGNLVSPGGSNLVAAGGGNIAFGTNAANLVAAGGGN